MTISYTIQLFCSLDINECETNEGGCEHICNNTMGSFECLCQQGFNLADDGLQCNGKTNFFIMHMVDVIVSIISCSDVDECLSSDRGGCEQSCINLQGSYECSCQQGYVLERNGSNCNGE